MIDELGPWLLGVLAVFGLFLGIVADLFGLGSSIRNALRTRASLVTDALRSGNPRDTMVKGAVIATSGVGFGHILSKSADTDEAELDSELDADIPPDVDDITDLGDLTDTT
jgi:hypothetical protein